MSEVERVCSDLDAALGEYRDAGFRLDCIYPADEPHSALLSRGEERVRLTTCPGAERPSGQLPPFRPEFLISCGGSAGEGRAGMLYRDLIPGRLGGRYIASHITIPDGGAVGDWVHYHRIALQMIYVARGWVRVVYEHHGEPFVMKAGDLVLQPPLIRHRVLESSPGLQVVEISAPALHETFADHELDLPNACLDPDHDFEGQRFLHHVGADAEWTGFCGGEAQETRLAEATAGLAQVRTVRPGASPTMDLAPHDGELVFGFVLQGSGRLDHAGSHHLQAADSFVIPPGEQWSLSALSENFRLLHVTTARLHAHQPSRR